MVMLPRKQTTVVMVKPTSTYEAYNYNVYIGAAALQHMAH